MYFLIRAASTISTTRTPVDPISTEAARSSPATMRMGRCTAKSIVEMWHSLGSSSP